jgi:hypothetical protein
VYIIHHTCTTQILLVLNKLRAERTETKFTWDAGGARHRDHMGLWDRDDASSLLCVCVILVRIQLYIYFSTSELFAFARDGTILANFI